MVIFTFYATGKTYVASHYGKSFLDLDETYARRILPADPRGFEELVLLNSAGKVVLVNDITLVTVCKQLGLRYVILIPSEERYQTCLHVINQRGNLDLTDADLRSRFEQWKQYASDANARVFTARHLSDVIFNLLGV